MLVATRWSHHAGKRQEAGTRSNPARKRDLWEATQRSHGSIGDLSDGFVHGRP